jgi:hypothetical protein
MMGLFTLDVDRSGFFHGLYESEPLATYII